MKKDDELENSLIEPVYYGAWHHTELSNEASITDKLSIIWSGWSHVGTALKECEAHRNSLAGEHYIAFGGGDVCGSFNPCCIEAITSAIQLGKLRDYDGVAYCLMEGSCGLSDVLEESFEVAHENGLQVLVSIAAPFGFADSDILIKQLLASQNIDIFSPQLYETSQDTCNNYAILAGDYDFSTVKAKLVPSLACFAPYSLNRSSFLFRDALIYFSHLGGVVEGFILSQPPLLSPGSNDRVIIGS